MYFQTPSTWFDGSRGLNLSSFEFTEKRGPTSTRPFSTLVSKRSSGRTGGGGGAPPPRAVVLALGLEAIERPDRRAAGHLAVELVDAAVARADEALGGLDVADRAA